VGGLEVANSVEDPGSSGFWRLRWEDEEERKQGSRAVRLCLEPSRVVLRTCFFCATVFSTAPTFSCGWPRPYTTYQPTISPPLAI
jgi:hypothetical protein